MVAIGEVDVFFVEDSCPLERSSWEKISSCLAPLRDRAGISRMKSDGGGVRTVDCLASGAMAELGRQRLITTQLVGDLPTVTASLKDALEVLLFGVDCIGWALLPLAHAIDAGVVLAVFRHLSRLNRCLGGEYGTAREVGMVDGPCRVCAQSWIGKLQDSGCHSAGEN